MPPGSDRTGSTPSAPAPSALVLAVWLCLAVGALGLALILFHFNPAKHGFYPVCLFHKATGLLCPGCGSLRAFHHLLNGELTTALRHNLLVVVSLPLFAFLAARLVLSSLGRNLRRLVIPNAWLWVGLALLIMFGIARNLPFAHTLWLAP